MYGCTVQGRAGVGWFEPTDRVLYLAREDGLQTDTLKCLPKQTARQVIRWF